jgi:hypothetical protein
MKTAYWFGQNRDAALGIEKSAERQYPISDSMM